MKRLLGLVVLLTAIAGFSLTPVTASAEQGVVPAPVTGRIWDYIGRAAVPGVTVEMRSTDGALLGTTTTASDGTFSVARNPSIKYSGDRVIKVTGNQRIQTGWFGNGYLQPSVDYADPVVDGQALGRVNATPSYIRGRIVNARTGRPVRRVAIALLRAGDNTLARTTTSDSEGVFVLRPIRGEDFNLRVDGRSVGFERGFRACNAQVVRTIGQACGSPLGAIGRVYLDRL